MTSSIKTPRPPHPSFDASVEREQSSVRPRAPRDERPPESIAERTARIDDKIALATLVLPRLSPADARARLLHSAVLRRDEVLLDAVLAQLTDEIVTLAGRARPR